MTLVQDRSGNSNGVDATYTGGGYPLFRNVTVAANTSTAPMSIRRSSTTAVGGTMALDMQFTGTSLKLQSLASDGVTWRDVATLNASGTQSVYIGGGSSVRVNNPNGTDVTNASASLS